MPRTTVDIDGSVLRRAKELARSEGKSLGQVISELLALSLEDRARLQRAPKLRWRTKPMRARVDLEDKDAVHSILDRT